MRTRSRQIYLQGWEALCRRAILYHPKAAPPEEPLQVMLWDTLREPRLLHTKLDDSMLSARGCRATMASGLICTPLNYFQRQHQ
jgi:hypothetical protein